MSKTKLLIVALSTIILYLTVFSSSCISVNITALLSTVCFILYTWWCLNKTETDEKMLRAVVITACISLFFTSVCLLFAIGNGYVTVFPVILAIVSVLLTTIYFKNRYVVEAVLSLVILVVLNVFGNEIWFMIMGR